MKQQRYLASLLYGFVKVLKKDGYQLEHQQKARIELMFIFLQNCCGSTQVISGREKHEDKILHSMYRIIPYFLWTMHDGKISDQRNSLFIIRNYINDS